MWKFIDRADLSSILGRVEALESRPKPPDLAPTLDSIEHDIDALQASSGDYQNQMELFEGRIKDLTIAIAEGIKGYEKSERRVQATIQRAQKELKARGLESPGLEAEAHDLRLVDGGRSDEYGVPAVPPEVAQAADQASSVPGVTLEQLQRARGLR